MFECCLSVFLWGVFGGERVRQQLCGVLLFTKLHHVYFVESGEIRAKIVYFRSKMTDNLVRG